VPSGRAWVIARNVAAAALCTFVMIAYAGSFGQLVFSGVLEPQVGHGILAALVGSVVMMLVLAWRSCFSFSVGGPDSNPSAVLAVTLASLSHSLVAAGGTEGPELLPTVLMFVFLSAIACGVVLLILGQWRGGRYMRFIPHPVVGGFLAGTGFLLVSGAYKALTGSKLTFSSLALIPDINPLEGGTALLVAVAMVGLSRRFRHAMVIPGVLMTAVLLFHGVRVGLGLDLVQAREAGLLLPPLKLTGWQHLGSLSVELVRWDLLLHHLEDLAAMAAVMLVTVLLNTTSLELATGVDADADAELRAIGVGNLVAGVLGGMVACTSLNRTLLYWRAGATSRWAGGLCAALIIGVMFLLPGIVGWLPRPVLTGLVLYIGITLLVAWAIEAGRTMPRMDYAVVLAILGMIAWLGIVAGVVLGVLIACVSFAVTLSRSPNVRHSFTAQNRRARVERTSEHLEQLRTRGAALRGFTLQGVLFFGTAAKLLEQVRAGLSKTRIVLLDFRLISGIDGSSIVVLKRIHTVCRDAGVKLVFTGLASRLESLLVRGGFDLGAPHVKCFADLDRGLEWCEDIILGQTTEVKEPPLPGLRVVGALSHSASQVILETAEQRRLEAGDMLVRQGEPSDAMYLVESGRVHVLLRSALAQGGDSIRLRTYGPGTIVGEMGFFTGEARSADIMAGEESRVLGISRACLEGLEASHPAVAREIHHYVIKSLAQRLRTANDENQLLL
jgi:SulP family sulfate permease